MTAYLLSELPCAAKIKEEVETAAHALVGANTLLCISATRLKCASVSSVRDIEKRSQWKRACARRINVLCENIAKQSAVQERRKHTLSNKSTFP